LEKLRYKFGGLEKIELVMGSGKIWEKTVTEERATGGRTNQNQMEYGKELAGRKKLSQKFWP
jgi:hypothetical protein